MARRSFNGPRFGPESVRLDRFPVPLHSTGSPGIRSLLSRSDLLSRLLILIGLATLPALAVLVGFQSDLHGHRDGLKHDLARQQAELVNAGLEHTLDGVSQVLAVLATHVGRGGECSDALRAVQQRLPFYLSLAMVKPDGTVLCGGPAALADTEPALIARAAAEPGLAVGHFHPGDGGGAFLALAQRDGGAGSPVAVAALGVDWLQQRLASLRGGAGGGVVLADDHGTVVAAFPPSAGLPGDTLPAGLLLRLASAESGTAPLPGEDAGIAGFVPLAVPPRGLFLAASSGLGERVVGIDRLATRGYLMIGLGGLVSLVLALLVAQRFVRKPTAVLLQAVKRWGDGDLAARAAVSRHAASEFRRLADAFNRMAEQQQRQRGELRALNDVLEVRVTDRTRALLDSNNRLQVEIAERELTEATLRQSQKLQAVGQLAGGIAHDFNNLLTALMGSLELLRKRAPADDIRQNRLLDTALEAVARGGRLTGSLLGFSRKQPLLSVPTDVGDALAGVKQLLASTMSPNVQVSMRIADDLWPAMLDPNQFEATVLNLALNARDAMPGGGRLLLTADNHADPVGEPADSRPPGDYVRLVVADTGTGMTDAVLARAFEPFFTTKLSGGGSGLGLAQVHGMVRQSGGSVRIESRAGNGTKVTILLPRSKRAPAAAWSPDTRGDTPAIGRDAAVLLVDDDTAVRELTATMLEENGYQVVAAANGAEALLLLQREGERIQLVIADYAMPGMDGHTLLKQVRRQRPGMPILLATGYADFGALIRDGLLAEQIIRKPFRGAELLARMLLACQTAPNPAD